MRSIEEMKKINNDAHRRFMERQEEQARKGTKKYDGKVVTCPICENTMIVGNDGKVEVVSG